MQPSHDEIQREVENLRDIRRRSTAQGGPGALILDPDLPTAAAHAAAAQAGYWSPDDSSSDSHSLEDGSDQGVASPADDPFHLFWVPANMHPEIDPAQFRNFLKEHAAPADGTTGVLARSVSGASTGLGRKKSMLSRQYSPSEHEGDDEDRVVPLRRNRSSLYQSTGPQLTIKDLEKLDELAEEASQSRDPSKLRNVLRRSMSMNMAPSVVDNMDNMPDLAEDADAPIIVPRPGQILRRAARTKIRKPGQTGEGAHRFNATRRGAGAQPPRSAEAPPEPRSSSDLSTSDHSGDAQSPRRQRMLSNASINDEPPRLVRPDSYSAESAIYDAYVTDEVSDEEAKLPFSSPISPPVRISISPPPPPARADVEPAPPALPVPPIPPVPTLPPLQPVLQHPVPQRVQSLQSPVEPSEPSRTPSPDSRATESPRPSAPEPLRATPPPSQSPDYRRDKDKDKDKKGLFKWGGEKKTKKEKEREREKEKESGFFGSLFGSKKKAEESPPPGLNHTQGREAAVALLGASKSSKGYAPPASPQPAGVDNYSRYPIHVERAIYRLSHIKLANPRRPLYEQVLISNLMFWYLGVINKTQSAQPAAGAAATAGQPQVGAPAEKEQREREEKERQEKLERERAEAEQAEKDRERAEQKTQGRRSLTKTAPAGAPPAGGRRAEMPVRGPQYDMQHRAMEQEYGYGGPVMLRPSSAPAAGYPPGGQPGSPAQQQQPHILQQQQQQHHYVGQPISPQPHSAHNPFVHSQQNARGGSPQLPPGARPPLEHTQAQAWQGVPVQTPPPAGRTMSSSPSPPRNSSPGRSRSPPPGQNRYNAVPGAEGKYAVPGAGKAPSRTQSATAVAPPGVQLVNGVGKPRKATSAHAVAPNNTRRPRTSEGVAGGGEEEDLPLAVWQQQQQRRR
ncbi:hypothetical protein FA95DRAFT_1550737 [Auriscalpium vulgare]|uniref:Uncharacterized protein n=1 Tax=Auriscalpium vulgare TaxID=40419 RepID=A0ACB8R6G0_9AGAM|nr:hypothetical protein FA95DRAFT_1550737 [Auriscalpium vulgare]